MIDMTFTGCPVAALVPPLAPEDESLLPDDPLLQAAVTATAAIAATQPNTIFI